MSQVLLHFGIFFLLFKTYFKANTLWVFYHNFISTWGDLQNFFKQELPGFLTLITIKLGLITTMKIMKYMHIIFPVTFVRRRIGFK